MPTINDARVTKPTQDQTDTSKNWPIWTCDISQFDWDYTQTEKCLILEGEVTVTDRPETGQTISFGPGDYVTFPVGLQCIWKVTKPVKKHYNFE